MSFKTKLIYKEKKLMSEMNDGHYLQVVERENATYIIFMSELELDYSNDISFKISIEDEVISFFNIQNNIDELTELNLNEIIEDESKTDGNIINFDVKKKELDILKSILEKDKVLKIFHFLTDDIQKIEMEMEELSFDIADGKERLASLSEEFKNYNIDESNSKRSLKNIAYDFCIENGFITPFYFIEKYDDLENTKEIDLPEFITKIIKI